MGSSRSLILLRTQLVQGLLQGWRKPLVRRLTWSSSSPSSGRKSDQLNLLYVCPHCGVQERSKTDLKKHIRSVHHLKAFVCPSSGCQAQFSNFKTLQKHCKSQHPGSKVPKEPYPILLSGSAEQDRTNVAAPKVPEHIEYSPSGTQPWHFPGRNGVFLAEFRPFPTERQFTAIKSEKLGQKSKVPENDLGYRPSQTQRFQGRNSVFLAGFYPLKVIPSVEKTNPSQKSPKMLSFDEKYFLSMLLAMAVFSYLCPER